MSFSVLINSVDRTSKVSKSTIDYVEVANDEMNTFSFSIRLESDDLSTLKPIVGQSVQFKEGSSIIFDGAIDRITEEPLENKLMMIKCECTESSTVFKNILVVDAFQNKSLLYVINTLLNDYGNRTNKLIEPMETGWTNGSQESTLYVEGEHSWSAQNQTINKTITTIDLTIFSNGAASTTADYIDFWVHVDDMANLTSIALRLGQDASNYFSKSVTTFVTGWNYFHLLKSSFSTTGTITWASIDDVRFVLTGTATCKIDDLRMVKSDAFTKYHLNTGDFEVEYIAWKYQPLHRAIKDLAELTAYMWFVDGDRDVHFQPLGFEGAAFEVTNLNGNMTKKTLVMNDTIEQVKNRIYVRGGEYLANVLYDQTIYGDGARTSFTIDYPYSGMTAEVSLSGGAFSAQSVGIDQLDPDDGTYDWFANFNQRIIRQATFGSPAPLDAVDRLKLEYYPYHPVIIQQEDASSIAIYGEHEFFILDVNLKTKEGARQRAVAELQAYQGSLVEGSFETIRSGLKAGTLLHVVDAFRNLDDYFVIWSINAKIRSETTLYFSVNLISKRKLTLVETLIKLILQQNKIIKLSEDEIIDKVSGHIDPIIIAETHSESLVTFTPATYGVDVDQGRYNLCQWG